MVSAPRGDAQAAILARLWEALGREPIPGVTGRTVRAGTRVVHLADGRDLSGPLTGPVALDLAGQRYDDPARLVLDIGFGPAGDRLAAELADSVANLALARAAQPVPDGGPPALVRYDLAGLEQCVVDGHPVHPLCRTRLGMS